MRERWRKRHYDNYVGLSFEVYQEMIAAQGSRCAVCRKKSDVLDVDHDHKSGVVRGLLCRRCNVGLGMLDDSPIYVKRALRYLMEDR